MSDIVDRCRDRMVCSPTQNSCRNDFALEQAAARIEELEVQLAAMTAERDRKDAAIKRQAGAAKTLRQCTLAEVQHIKDNERKEYVASRTLDSEREANAILTEENEALQARIAELEAMQEVLMHGGKALQARAEAAEAKLAKAVAPLSLPRPDSASTWKLDPKFVMDVAHAIQREEGWDATMEAVELAMLAAEKHILQAETRRATLAELKGDNATPTTHRQRGGFKGGV